MDNVTIVIQNGHNGYEPVVLNGVQWQTERKGNPGKLTFKVMRDENLKLDEGSVVSMKVGSTPVFYGYLFRLSGDKTNVVNLTCYDQLRYLKNKDTYIFENTTANRIAKMLCDDFGCRYGELEETSYVIPYVIYDNKTLLDMIQDSIDMTLTNTRKLHVLYDDYGKITIKQIARMKVGLMIDADTAETFSYDFNIDDSTYNRIKLMYEDTENNERTFWTAEDKGTQSKWGTLQYTENISKEETDTAQMKANALLELFNNRMKRLTVYNCIGDLRVRAGSMVMVQMMICGEKVNHWMVVDSCTHHFEENGHFMTLKLIGGGFVG